MKLVEGNYESRPISIGLHEWRVVKWLHTFCGSCEWVTSYEWRRIGNTNWNRDKTWPTYNINDGSYGGLPKSLKKLWIREQEALYGLEPAQRTLL